MLGPESCGGLTSSGVFGPVPRRDGSLDPEKVAAWCSTLPDAGKTGHCIEATVFPSFRAYFTVRLPVKEHSAFDRLPEHSVVVPGLGGCCGTQCFPEIVAPFIQF